MSLVPDGTFYYIVCRVWRLRSFGDARWDYSLAFVLGLCAELENIIYINSVLLFKMAAPRPVLRRLTSMKERVQDSVLEYRNQLLDLLSRYPFSLP